MLVSEKELEHLFNEKGVLTNLAVDKFLMGKGLIVLRKNGNSYERSLTIKGLQFNLEDKDKVILYDKYLKEIDEIRKSRANTLLGKMGIKNETNKVSDKGREDTPIQEESHSNTDWE